MSGSRRDLQYYLSLKYPAEIVESEGGGYFARIPELPGCMTHGETLEELWESIEDAKATWLEAALEDGTPIPEPRREEHSGRVLLRMRKGLHRQLAEQAEREGVSLNHYLVSVLSDAVAGRNVANQVLDRVDSMFDRMYSLPQAQQTVRLNLVTTDEEFPRRSPSTPATAASSLWTALGLYCTQERTERIDDSVKEHHGLQVPVVI